MRGVAVGGVAAVGGGAVAVIIVAAAVVVAVLVGRGGRRVGCFLAGDSNVLWHCIFRVQN